MSLADVALLSAIKAFARGKRWQVDCATCGKERLCLDVSDLGRTQPRRRSEPHDQNGPLGDGPAVARTAVVDVEVLAHAPIEPAAIRATAVASAAVAGREHFGAQVLERERPPARDGRAVAAERAKAAGEALADEGARVALRAALARRGLVSAVVLVLVAAAALALAWAARLVGTAHAPHGGSVRGAPTTLHGKRIA